MAPPGRLAGPHVCVGTGRGPTYSWEREGAPRIRGNGGKRPHVLVGTGTGGPHILRGDETGPFRTGGALAWGIGEGSDIALCEPLMLGTWAKMLARRVGIFLLAVPT